MLYFARRILANSNSTQKQNHANENYVIRKLCNLSLTLYVFLLVGRKPFIKSKNQDVLVDDKITAITIDVGSNLTLVTGSSVTVICEIQGEPKPTINWYQNGNHVLSNLNKTSLRVGNPVQVNLQTVTCTTDNILGTDSKSSYFKILGK